jgi:two-component system sensor histidine kinase VicK
MFAEDLRLSIEMDRDRIEQVLLNILGNAIKYTEEKGRIDVDIIPGQNCVQIVISDNGLGIPEEDLSRVFERFYRVDKARSGKTGGTGLGLAISKQIVEAHDGTINIESKLGRGTSVTVSLPIVKTRGTPGIL